MGGDGGSIRRRSDMVHVKKRGARLEDPAVVQRGRWTTCALSAKPLQHPVVACELGFLYNREAVCEYLANLLQGAQQPIPQFAHLKSLRDVFPCVLYYAGGASAADAATSAAAAAAASEDEARVFSCPVSGVDGNGRYAFVRVTGCGCVIAQKAVDSVAGASRQQVQEKQEEIKEDRAAGATCIACGKLQDLQEAAVFSEKELADLDPEQLNQVRATLPPKASLTPLNAAVEVVEALREASGVRQVALQRAKAQLKSLRKAQKKSNKRKQQDELATGDEAAAPEDGSEATPDRDQRRKKKKQKQAAARPVAPAALSQTAKLAREAEQTARAKLSDNLKSLFMSEEKRREAPSFISTRMQSPMSQL